jgi:hypothetical protein
MIAPLFPDGPAALATRWREDAEVFRRYGAGGRARMLERMAAELERSTRGDRAARVDLRTAADLSGFSRSHLRRLIRTGKLSATKDGAGNPLLRVSDLPRKAGRLGGAPATWPSGREAVAELLRSRPAQKNRKSEQKIGTAGSGGASTPARPPNGVAERQSQRESAERRSCAPTASGHDGRRNSG